MSQKIIRIGSSFGITVSPIILDELGWRQGTRIELTIDSRTNSLKVVKSEHQDPRKTVKSLGKKTRVSSKRK